MSGYVHQRIHVVPALVAKDITGAAQTGQWICCKYYRQICVEITQGAWAGGTPAVTLMQAQSITGTNPKALSFTKRWQQAVAGGAAGYVESAVTNDTFQLPNTPNQVHLLEIDAAQLDTDNGYDCLQVNIASPGAFTDLLSVTYICDGARYSGATLPNALAN